MRAPERRVSGVAPGVCSAWTVSQPGAAAAATHRRRARAKGSARRPRTRPPRPPCLPPAPWPAGQPPGAPAQTTTRGDMHRRVMNERACARVSGRGVSGRAGGLRAPPWRGWRLRRRRPGCGCAWWRFRGWTCCSGGGRCRRCCGSRRTARSARERGVGEAGGERGRSEGRSLGGARWRRVQRQRRGREGRAQLGAGTGRCGRPRGARRERLGCWESAGRWRQEGAPCSTRCTAPRPDSTRSTSSCSRSSCSGSPCCGGRRLPPRLRPAGAAVGAQAIRIRRWVGHHLPAHQGGEGLRRRMDLRAEGVRVAVEGRLDRLLRVEVSGREPVHQRSGRQGQPLPLRACLTLSLS